MGLGIATGISPCFGLEGAFAPLSVANTTTLLRTDAGVTLNAGNVATWADQSGGGHNATQGTGAAQPLFTASDPDFAGAPSIAGDGAARYLGLSAPLGSPCTLLMVLKPSTVASSYDACGAAANSAAIISKFTTTLTEWFNGGDRYTLASDASPLVFMATQTDAANLSIYVNNALQQSVTPTAVLAGAVLSFLFRAAGGTPAYSNAKLGVVQILSRVVTTAERNYLARGWGARHGIAVA